VTPHICFCIAVKRRKAAENWDKTGSEGQHE
jgi:hypothetical protein